MRLGEICTIRRSGIRVVYADGSEGDLECLQELPRLGVVAGLLFHLPWRKNHVARDCWVPVACKTTIKLVLRQVKTLRACRSQNPCLFPSRIWRKGGKQLVNPRNYLQEQSWIDAMRVALVRCVPGMTVPWANLFSGHSMRVGGSNHMRQLGVADDIHRRMGG